MIAGTNGYGIQSRYAIYRKGPLGLSPHEFAFGLDNLGHIVFMPWFTLHANDPEALLLAAVSRAIRADKQLGTKFSRYLDALLKAHGICQRGSDGFLQPLDEDMALPEYLHRNAALWQQAAADGYAEHSVAALKRAGYEAWINPVGDISVQPPPGRLPLG